MRRARLDATDWLILRELLADGRITNVELARKVGISAPPCLRRVRALEEAGIVRGFTAILNDKVLGFDVTAFAMIRLHRQAEADLIAFEEHAQSSPIVRDCYMLSGEIDFMLKCVAPDLGAFQEFIIHELTAAPNVASVKTSLVIRASKHAAGVPLELVGDGVPATARSIVVRASAPHHIIMSERGSSNPVLVEILRGALVESSHTGAIAVADARGRLMLALGDVKHPVYPRSAVKAMQGLPLLESGAADAFALSEAELAVACASHSGDRVHLDTVGSLLAKAGLDDSYLACGAHWPVSEAATRELLRAGQRPRAIHNNCSGKHAGMLATAKHLGLDPRGYEQPDHPVQLMIARIISEICGNALDRARMGIDGCSVPTFALPLAALAGGFARLGSGEGLPFERTLAARRLLHACFAEPLSCRGRRAVRHDRAQDVGAVMLHQGRRRGSALRGVTGARARHRAQDRRRREACGGTSHERAARCVVPEAQHMLADQLGEEMQNWKGIVVGRVAPSEALRRAVAPLMTPSILS